MILLHSSITSSCNPLGYCWIYDGFHTCVMIIIHGDHHLYDGLHMFEDRHFTFCVMSIWNHMKVDQHKRYKVCIHIWSMYVCPQFWSPWRSNDDHARWYYDHCTTQIIHNFMIFGLLWSTFKLGRRQHKCEQSWWNPWFSRPLAWRLSLFIQSYEKF